MSSGKTSNLPLLLPWAVALAPAWRLGWQRPATTLAVALVAASASFLPMAALNARYVGDWTGLAAEGLQLSKGEPVIRVVNNTVMLGLQNFVPPVFPFASRWNQAAEHLFPFAYVERVKADFELGAASWTVGELQVEETAGWGFGLSTLVLISSGAALIRRKFTGPRPARKDWQRLVVLTPWVALLAFMLKSNLATAARLALPYFGLLLPAVLLLGNHTHVVRQRWWRAAAVLLTLPAFVLLVLSPQRPLWPAQSVLTKLNALPSPHPLARRAQAVYAVYAQRHDGFKPLRALLPPAANPLGLMATDEPETSLWRPFGVRRILHVKTTDSSEQIRQRGIEYLLISGETWQRLGPKPLEAWIAELPGAVIWQQSLKLRASSNPVDWYLVRLAPPRFTVNLQPPETSLRPLGAFEDK